MPEPRPAATMVLVREGDVGVEVLLVQRLPTAIFGPGAWVFPGGGVDEGDLALATFYPELADQLAQRMRLEPLQAIAYLGAALRETVEETGILVGSDIPPACFVASALPDLLDELGGASALPDLRNVLYLSRWITPVGLTRRYDTRFFLAQVGDRCDPVLNPEELVASRWIAPAEALGRHRAGELLMMRPTAATLGKLASYTSREEMWRDLRERPPESYLPGSLADVDP